MTVQTSKPLSEIGLINDIVSSIDRLGLVPGDLHRDAPWHAGSLEVPHGGSSQVVGYPPWTPGSPTGDFPRCLEAPDRLSVAIEDPGTDDTTPTQVLCKTLLLLQHRLQLPKLTERQDPPPSVLGAADVESHNARLHVHLSPLD